MGRAGPDGDRTHVIPAEASAKINIRLVAGQRPRVIERLTGAHLAARSPAGIWTRLHTLSRVEPWQLTDLAHPALLDAAAAVRQVWGAPPTLVRSGGSISAVSLLAHAIPRVAPALLGFTLPGENAHAADEHVDLNRLLRAAHTITDLVDRLGDYGAANERLARIVRRGGPAHRFLCAAPAARRRTAGPDGRPCRRGARVRHPNVYADTSGVRYFDALANAAGRAPDDVSDRPRRRCTRGGGALTSFG